MNPHREGNAAVVIHSGGAHKDVANGCALSLEATGSASIDEKVRSEGLKCKIGGHSGGDSPHIVHAVHAALAWAVQGLHAAFASKALCFDHAADMHLWSGLQMHGWQY